MTFELNPEVAKTVEVRIKSNSLTQEPFDWGSRKSKWIDEFPDFKIFLDNLDNPLGRHDLRKVFSSSDYSTAQQFLAVMVWGYADRGYGPFRVKKIFEQANCEADISAAIDFCKAGKPLEAYAHLSKNRIRGLGPAFGTKIFSFATPQNIAAPIYDSFVAKWVKSFELEAFKGCSLSPESWNIKTYTRYVEWVDFHARVLGCCADEIELAIFEDGLSKFARQSPWDV